MVEYTVVEFTYGGIYHGGIYLGGIYRSPLEYLSEVVITAAKESIPRSKGKFRRKPVLWWNMECHIARKAMRAAFTRYRRHKCPYYLISFKGAHARFRFQVKQAKRQSRQWHAEVL